MNIAGKRLTYAEVVKRKLPLSLGGTKKEGCLKATWLPENNQRGQDVDIFTPPKASSRIIPERRMAISPPEPVLYPISQICSNNVSDSTLLEIKSRLDRQGLTDTLRSPVSPDLRVRNRAVSPLRGEKVRDFYMVGDGDFVYGEGYINNHPELRYPKITTYNDETQIAIARRERKLPDIGRNESFQCKTDVSLPLGCDGKTYRAVSPIRTRKMGFNNPAIARNSEDLGFTRANAEKREEMTRLVNAFFDRAGEKVVKKGEAFIVLNPLQELKPAFEVALETARENGFRYNPDKSQFLNIEALRAESSPLYDHQASALNVPVQRIRETGRRDLFDSANFQGNEAFVRLVFDKVA